MRREHRRQCRRHHADKEVQHNGQDQQAGEDQPDLAAGDQHKGWNGQQQQTYTAGNDERLAADFVTDKTDERLHEQHADHDCDDDQYTAVFFVVQVVGQVARHVGEQHVVRHVGGRHNADAGQQAAPMLGGDFLERHFRAVGQTFAVALFEGVHVLLERRGFFQRVAQVKTDDAQGQGQEERQAPAPGFKLFFAEDAGNQHHHTRAEHETGDGTEVQPTAEKAALAVRRIFGNEDRRAGVFTAYRETLGHFAQQQQDRRPDTDGGVAGDQTDGEGTQRHDHDGRRQHLLSSVFVPQGAEEQATQRTDQERHRECSQCGNHLHTGRSGREKHLAQHIGDKPVDAKVEPFHGVTQCSGGDRLAHLGVIDNGDVIQSDGIDAFLT